jgi:hypothetical protein
LGSPSGGIATALAVVGPGGLRCVGLGCVRQPRGGKQGAGGGGGDEEEEDQSQRDFNLKGTRGRWWGDWDADGPGRDSVRPTR